MFLQLYKAVLYKKACLDISDSFMFFILLFFLFVYFIYQWISRRRWRVTSMAGTLWKSERKSRAVSGNNCNILFQLLVTVSVSFFHWCASCWWIYVIALSIISMVWFTFIVSVFCSTVYVYIIECHVNTCNVSLYLSVNKQRYIEYSHWESSVTNNMIMLSCHILGRM